MDTLEFLDAFHPGGPWVLASITVDRKSMETVTFNTQAEVTDWVEKHNGKRNLYFMVNRAARPLTKKAQKEDITAAAYLHVDVDARAREDLTLELERIRKLLTEFVPAPTFIVHSGGGYQAFWRLKESVTDPPTKVEAYNKQLENLLGGDHCSNVDRIMRLPGTTNIPDAKKVERGRVPCKAEVCACNADAVYALDAFPVPATVAVENAHGVSLDDLNVDAATKQIIIEGHLPTEPAKPSRSEWLYRAVCALRRAGVERDVVREIITNPRFRISESVLEKGARAARYAERQIDRADAEVTCEFQKSEKGVVCPNQGNIRVAIHKLGGELAYDVFADRLLIDGAHLDDSAMSGLYLEIERRFGFRPGKEYFWMVAEDVARAHEVHPVRDYLDSLTWDCTPRLDRWLVAYAGADDTEYTRTIGAIVLIAAVRRVRQPGCKFDEMLVLESPQGQAKSTALAVLAVREDWFSEDLPLNADSKRQIEATAGRWIVEAGELKGMRSGEVEHLKNYLSRRTDRARMAYGRLVTEIPRQFVIIGTTNSDRYLRDNTGNRRFWPVRVGEIDLKRLRADRDQLWAEAAVRESGGESIRLARELWDAAAVEQQARHVEDPFLSALAEALGERRGKLRASDAWNIVGVPPGLRTQDHNARLGEAMRQLGWRRAKRRFGGPPEFCYVRGEGADLEQIVEPNARQGAF